MTEFTCHEAAKPVKREKMNNFEREKERLERPWKHIVILDTGTLPWLSKTLKYFKIAQ